MEKVDKLLDKVISLNKIKKWKEVVQLLPDTLLADYNDSNLYAEKAQSFWFLKEFDECKKNAEKSLKISLNTKAYNCLARISLESKDYALAEEYYKKAIEIDSNYLGSYNGLGLIFRRKKEFKNSEDYFKKALEIDLLNPTTYHGLGNLYIDLENYLLAEEYFRKALEIDSSYSYAYTGLGNIAIAKKKYALAKEYYEKGIEIDSTNPVQHYNLGLAYNLLNEKTSAEKCFKNAIALDEKYTFAFNGLGNICKNTDRLKEAEEYYKKAIELDRTYDISYYNLGLLYYDSDNIVEAKKTFEKYLIYANDKESFTYKNTLSKIDEINKKIDNFSYKKISQIVKQIKELLRFGDDCISHYTSISTAQILLLNESPFRLSEGTFLNDTSEGEELFKFLKDSNDSIRENNVTIFTKRPFIGSFVDANKNNDLTLWRMYGKEKLEEAKGCSVTLNVKEFKDEIKKRIYEKGEIDSSNNQDIEFYRVVYRKEGNFCFSGSTLDADNSLDKLMVSLKAEYSKFIKKKNIQKNEEIEIIELLNEIAYLFKSVEYQYENEIRLVINEGVGFDKIIDVKEKDFMPSYHPNRVYIELVPIAPLLKTITIGPKVDRAEEWASTFHYFLGNKGLKPEIHISKLPFK